MSKKEVLSQDDVINDFISRLVKERNLENLDKEVIMQIKNDLKDRVIETINATIIEKMPADKLGEFENLLDTGSEQDIQDFCVKNIQNFASLIGLVLSEFATTYLK